MHEFWTDKVNSGNPRAVIEDEGQVFGWHHPSLLVHGTGRWIWHNGLYRGQLLSCDCKLKHE